jgi:hypothetical protein
MLFEHTITIKVRSSGATIYLEDADGRCEEFAFVKTADKVVKLKSSMINKRFKVVGTTIYTSEYIKIQCNPILSVRTN